MVHHLRKSCRSCAGTELEHVLNLGRQPLGNAFLMTPEEFEDEHFYQLDLYVCSACSLVQILDVIDPNELFGKYAYPQGESEAGNEHVRQFAADLLSDCALTEQDLVVDVACGEGRLLSRLSQAGVRTVGVEAARNIAVLCGRTGVETINARFGKSLATKLRAKFGPAKLCIASGILAQVDEPRELLEAMLQLLGENGSLVIEVPYWRDFLERTEYDGIHHEYCCYFSLASLLALCESVGLRLSRAQSISTNGGSLRIQAHRGGNLREHAPEVQEMLAAEQALGLNEPDSFRAFASAAKRNRDQLLSLLGQLRSEGKHIAAYGSPAEGSTLLNYCHLGTELIDFAVDDMRGIVDLYTPGMHLPVLKPRALLDRDTDYVLILARNLAEEIIAREEQFTRRGGRFIIPLPEPKIIG